MDNITKINKILKWLLIIGFILLAFLSIKYGFNNCSKCDFTYQGENINPKEVWEIYSNKCLSVFTIKEGFYNLNFSNFTIT